MQVNRKVLFGQNERILIMLRIYIQQTLSAIEFSESCLRLIGYIGRGGGGNPASVRRYCHGKLFPSSTEENLVIYHVCQTIREAYLSLYSISNILVSINFLGGFRWRNLFRVVKLRWYFIVAYKWKWQWYIISFLFLTCAWRGFVNFVNYMKDISIIFRYTDCIFQLNKTEKLSRIFYFYNPCTSKYIDFVWKMIKVFKH